jgi:hypothetical protein
MRLTRPVRTTLKGKKMDHQDYLALRKALNLLHQFLEKEGFHYHRILVEAEDVLRDHENKEGE